MQVKEPLKYLSKQISVRQFFPFIQFLYYITWSQSQTDTSSRIPQSLSLLTWVISLVTPLLPILPIPFAAVFFKSHFLPKVLWIPLGQPSKARKQAGKQWIRENQPRADIWIKRLIKTDVRMTTAWLSEVYSKLASAEKLPWLVQRPVMSRWVVPPMPNPLFLRD